jgi:1,4-dihydroxy-2-naphthoate octaprenyltransferase
VRAILATHASRRTIVPVPAAAGSNLASQSADLGHPDPNSLVPAPPLQAALEDLRQARGEDAVRAVAADYAALWARTFRTLVVHLRGRPERALALFAEEVYPFLRGDRLAARIESAAPGTARIRLAHDLPDAYLAALVESFVGLSRARTQCRALGGGVFEVRYKVVGSDRLARISQQLALLRIPLLLAALLATLLGIVLAYREVGVLEPWRVGATLLGGLAAQTGANALHDRRTPHPAGILSPLQPSMRALRRLMLGGYVLAGLLGLLLAVAAPVVLLFAAAGLVVSLLFSRFRSQGFGPILAGLTYGPLMAEGALHAVAPAATDHWAHLVLVVATLPLGALAAAILYLDDLADRPLDEAGGQRTLLVRLPRRTHFTGYAALLLAGLGSLFLVLRVAAPATQAWVLALAVPAVFLLVSVRRHLDDPHGLGPARLGTLGFHIAAGVLLVLALVTR